MQKCDGTTATQAYDNLILRENIATHPDVAVFFGKFKLEDGNFVKLDRHTASYHVKACINEIKKTRDITRRNFTRTALKHEVTMAYIPLYACKFVHYFP